MIRWLYWISATSATFSASGGGGVVTGEGVRGESYPPITAFFLSVSASFSTTFCFWLAISSFVFSASLKHKTSEVRVQTLAASMALSFIEFYALLTSPSLCWQYPLYCGVSWFVYMVM